MEENRRTLRKPSKQESETTTLETQPTYDAMSEKSLYRHAPLGYGACSGLCSSANIFVILKQTEDEGGGEISY